MNRREFINHIALITAGTLVHPDQFKEYKRGLEINAIEGVNDGLIIADEVSISGMAERSTPTFMEIFTNDEPELDLGVNLFGGVIRWISTVEHRMRITTPDKFTIQFKAKDDQLLLKHGKDFRGYIRYIDQSGRYQMANLKNLIPTREDGGVAYLTGTLADLIK